ncbi:hypothetical protein [Flavitalea sp.]|nr:hypothetical protein [Flavitalea sp.]
MLNTLSNLFKTAPESIPNKRNSRIVFFMAILISFAMLTLRSPFALVHPQFWAEDGSVFFQDAYNTGIRSFTISYAGYFHLIPRTVAYFTYLFVPHAYAPVAYMICSLLGFMFILFYIWTRTGFDLHARFLMCLALTFVPIKSEIVLNLANLQWYTAVLSFIVLISPPDKKKLLPDLLIVLIVGLTGPFNIVLLPGIALLALFNSWRHKDRRINPLILIVFAATAVIQLISVLTTPTRIPNNLGPAGMLQQLPYVVYIHLANLPGLLRLYTAQINYAIFSVLLILMAAWIYASFRQFQKTKDFRVLFLVISALSLIVANLYGYDLIKDFYRPMIVGRYFLIPSVLLIWSGILYVSLGRKNYFPFYLLYFWYLIILLARLEIFQMGNENLQDKHWKAEAQKINNIKNDQLIIPINPEGWFIKLNGNKTDSSFSKDR